MNPPVATDNDLIARLIDGPADAAAERELARRIAADPALGRLVVRHLRIAELAHQQAAPERTADGFLAGWQVRLAAEADAAVFTARTVLRIGDAERERRYVRIDWAMRLGGAAAAAALVLAIAGGVSALTRAGGSWVGNLASNGTPLLVHGTELARLQRELSR